MSIAKKKGAVDSHSVLLFDISIHLQLYDSTMTLLLQTLVIIELLLYGVVLCDNKDDVTPTILYVTPSPSIPCPGMPCYTLSQYSQDQGTKFRSDTELHFLSGVHRLNSQIPIEGGTNITELAFVGERQRQSEIVTSTSGGLKLIGMRSIRIESLKFSGINVLTVKNSSSLMMNDLQITAMNGSAFTFDSIDHITGTNVEIGNSSDTYLIGDIRLSNGIFSNMTVKNNSGNSIMIIEESFVQFMGISTFINNRAIKGSTLMITASTVIFNGSIFFQSNKCKNKGGAMNIVNSNVTLFGETELSGNSAKGGGAIQVDYSVLELKGLIYVSNNWVTKKVFSGQVFGGAISSIESSITMTGNVTYSGNYIYALFLMGFGGAICAQRSTITLSGTICFHDNYAKSILNLGGAILLSNSTLAATDITLTFKNNTAQTGGAIAITGLLNRLPSTIVVKGTTLFDANVAVSGGALYGTHFMYIRFFGNTTLSRNEGQRPGVSQIAIAQASMADIQFNGYTEIKDSISTGSTVSFQGSVHTLFNGTTKFINNTGLWGVLQVLDNNASIVILGQSYFKSNRGGTIILKADSKPSNPSMISGEATFIDNDSGISLAYSEIHLKGNLDFTDNHGPRLGCISAFGSKVLVNGTVLMSSNTAETGPAIYSYNSSISMYCNHCHFVNNSVVGDGGAVFALRTTLYLDGNISFSLNSASNRGGTIWAVNSELFLSGHHVYVNNSANAGGVFSLGLFAVFHFNDLSVTFDNNRAEKGAIFHHDDILSAVDCLDNGGLPAPIEPLSIRTQCFFSITDSISITSTGNTASDVGNILFGGNLKRCNRRHATEVFINLFHTDDSIQNISSNPYQIVFCKNNRPIIISSGSSQTTTIDTIPGKLFSVSVAGLNQLLKPILTTVRAEISAESNLTGRLGSFQSKQLTNNSCTNLNYRVFTQAPNFDLTLYAEGPCNKLGTAAKKIVIKLGPCPNGFELVGDECHM